MLGSLYPGLNARQLMQDAQGTDFDIDRAWTSSLREATGSGNYSAVQRALNLMNKTRFASSRWVISLGSNRTKLHMVHNAQGR